MNQIVANETNVFHCSVVLSISAFSKTKFNTIMEPFQGTEKYHEEIYDLTIYYKVERDLISTEIQLFKHRKKRSTSG